MQEKSFTLLELTSEIQQLIRGSLKPTYWVVAEISDVTINRSGHCYLELIEKDEISNKIIAKSRAIIWAFTFRMLKPYFETTTGREFSSELKVLLKVTVEFHNLYGLSLTITDIDPTYTLGDIAQKRIEIIKKLEEDGIINMNKEIPFPSVPQKIAVISSETAAGYGDFLDQLQNNEFGYKFYCKLFPAIMQGDKSSQSIIDALDRVFPYEDFFDVVIIIRGGGAKSELSCFDDYNLAVNVAQFPLPIITGIGHERDESIVDMVANTKSKTPTAVAEFLISRVSYFNNYLIDLKGHFIESVSFIIANQKAKVDIISNRITPILQRRIDNHKSQLVLLNQNFNNSLNHFTDTKKQEIEKAVINLKYSTDKLFLIRRQLSDKLSTRLLTGCEKYLYREKHNLKMFEKTNESLNPENILKRGYSITIRDNKIIKSIDQINDGDEIQTKLQDGVFNSKIIKTKLNGK